MRKMMLLAALVAIAALMMAAAPAFADDGNHNNRNDFCDRFDINNCHRFFNDNNDRFVVFDGFDHFNNFRPFDFDNEISQENEQEVESGDATQNINVSGGGANSNQCAGVQGVTNTGNATNNTSVLQANPNDGFFRDGFHDGRFHDGFFRDGFNNN